MKLFDYLIVLLFLAFFGWFYAGFYQVDPFYFTGGASSGLQKALLAVRILLPPAAAAVLAIYILIRRSIIPGWALGLSLIGILIAGVALYLPVSHFYYNSSSATRVAGYHPYLQYSPPDFVPRANLDGEKPLRIFFIGGSTTEWADSNGVTWQSLVEEDLRRSPELRKVECYNLGKEWYTSQHILINYELNLRPQRPDLIVVMVAINDLLVNADFGWISSGAFAPDYRHFYGPVTRMVKRVSFPGMLYEKFRAAWYHIPRTVVDQSEFPGLSSYLRNLRTIAELARLDGSQVVLMTEPFLYKESMTPAELSRLTMLNYSAIGPKKQWGLRTVLTGMQQYNGAMRSLAEETSAPLIDLELAVPKELKYIRDDVHYTDEAFPIVAGAVASELRKILSTASPG